MLAVLLCCVYCCDVVIFNLYLYLDYTYTYIHIHKYIGIYSTDVYSLIVSRLRSTHATKTKKYLVDFMHHTETIINEMTQKACVTATAPLVP